MDSQIHNTKPFDIAIVGGGITGLTLAIALLKRHIPFTIYEQAPKFGEIGAGVAFTPNAVDAMRICAPEVYDGFNRVATRNQWKEKANDWFDWVDGYHHGKSGVELADCGAGGRGGDGKAEKFLFKVENRVGANSVHRAHYLDELIKLVPEGVSKFGKRLDDIAEGAEGKLVMKFLDGSSDVADAVIGCDGIKSRVRQLILGRGNPASYPHYSHKYAYRGLIPMDKAVEVIGEDNAKNAKMHMGPNGHVLTFPVNHGRTMNVVAFRTNPDPWPDPKRLTLPAKISTAKDEFAGWGANVMTILDMLDSDLDCWALFDTYDHPAPTFCKGRTCVSGDAAHATTPHHGAGAGFGIEDSAVLAELLADAAALVKGGEVERCAALEGTFAAFDACRRERTQWLVRSSRIVGDLYEWRGVVEAEDSRDGKRREFGQDIAAIEEEVRWRCEKVWNADVSQMVQEAKAELVTRLRGMRAKHKLQIEKQTDSIQLNSTLGPGKAHQTVKSLLS